MSHFDSVAREWDKNSAHTERSLAISNGIQESVPLNKNMKAMEFGAGTGILSFLLHNFVSDIVMMDSSREMVNVMNEKVSHTQVQNLKPLFFNLEIEEYSGNRFDLVFTQMVLHHVDDVEELFRKFSILLNPGGYLAIADLYTEDGSFHGSEVKVHKGFDPHYLASNLQLLSFTNTNINKCFTLKRENDREYPIFLLTAQKAY